MLTIIYSTHKDEEYNKKFKEHLLHTVGLKNVRISSGQYATLKRLIENYSQINN